jgi:hypothetical protein
MTPLRLLAIAAILFAATAGWFILGGSVAFRTEDSRAEGLQDVGYLWGGSQVQEAPSFAIGGRPVAIAGSDITADIELDQRKKGLLWYSTYAVDYEGQYVIADASGEGGQGTMRFSFPTTDGIYDGFAVSVAGKDVPVTYGEGVATARFDVAPGESVPVMVGYRTQGQDEWRYAPSQGSVDVIEDFSLVMTTDFEDIDFPSDTVSPTTKTAAQDGWVLTWEYDRLVSGRPIGLTMPSPLEPGPTASRISFFAPISLLFYFAAVVLVSATRGVRIHPVNYAFLAAGMFAFHLLFAYLVDRVDIVVAFGIAAAVSLAMCTGYLSLFIKDRRALAELAVSQLVFLVLFSFTFFFEGLTGLAIAIGSVITLGYFMARTGHVDWFTVFGRKSTKEQPVPADPGLLEPQS